MAIQDSKIDVGQFYNYSCAQTFSCLIACIVYTHMKSEGPLTAWICNLH